MGYEDYNQEEIINIINELRTVYYGKLKQDEAHFIEQLSNQHTVSNVQRDTLIKLYDSISDGNIEG